MIMSPRTTWADAPDCVLEYIFWLACQSQPQPSSEYTLQEANPVAIHNPALPLVCRQWGGAYRHSRLLWRHIALDWAAEFPQSPSTSSQILTSLSRLPSAPQFGLLARWLRDRGPCVETARYGNCHTLGAALELHLLDFFRVTPQLTAIELGGVAGAADAIVDALCCATTLKYIRLAPHQPAAGLTPALRVHVSALAGLSTLTSLQRLDLEVDRLAGSSADLSAWSVMQNLTDLRLVGRMEAPVVHPDFLPVLSMLRTLELRNVRLPQFNPALVAALGLVTGLTLAGVLAARPRRKSGFTLWEALSGLRSLQALSVAGAGEDARLPCSALACTALRDLSFSDCLLGDWPPTRDAKACAALDTLQALHFREVSLGSGTPPPAIWARLQGLTALTWRAVRQPRNGVQLWPMGQPEPLPNGLTHVMRGLRSLRLEYTGLSERLLVLLCDAVKEASQLQGLSFEGNRLGGSMAGWLLRDALLGRKLVHLSLANCSFTALPEEIFLMGDASNLTLDLRDNPRLRTTPAEDARLAQQVKRVLRNDRQALLAAVPGLKAHAAVGV